MEAMNDEATCYDETLNKMFNSHFGTTQVLDNSTRKSNYNQRSCRFLMLRTLQAIRRWEHEHWYPMYDIRFVEETSKKPIWGINYGALLQILKLHYFFQYSPHNHVPFMWTQIYWFSLLVYITIRIICSVGAVLIWHTERITILKIITYPTDI